ncbi:MAG: CDP-alcohol phosphatidyltransferase family protein [Acidobacteriota bacterium]
MRTVPNLLTLLRIALTPLVVRAIVARRFGEALAILAVAAVTDALDGYLARKFDAQSRFGAYVDPIADKTLLSAGYVALGVAGAVPWWLVGLIFGRDLLILALAGAALAFTSWREFPPSIWGKLSTFCQIAAALAVLTAGAFPGWKISADPFLWIAAAATIWSGAGYVWRAVSLVRRRGPYSLSSIDARSHRG